MQGYFSLVLHAHLPFVRHPEHKTFLEESWLFETITETYIPLLLLIRGWAQEGIHAPFTLTLSPTLCAMLRDPLLRRRYARYLDQLLELTEKEVHRTLWEKPFQALAIFYRERLESIAAYYRECDQDLVDAFRKAQDAGQVEIITCAATHAVLPLLASHPPSLRAQIMVARDDYCECFGRAPVGIWLPECAYDPAVEPVLKEAGLRWFILDTHGLMHARPAPVSATFAPVLTPGGLAAFGRDLPSARQVWSRGEGYPGDPRYRDFYRDIGFDLEFEYLRPFLSSGERRSFTGIKYFAITGRTPQKQIYSREAALAAADAHARHFLEARTDQIRRAAEILQQPPLLVAPYDAELFGHWWYEGPEFLNLFVRKAFYDQSTFRFVTPSEYLSRYPRLQIAQPASSSWGEEGYWRMWLDEANQWIYPHVRVAGERITELVEYSEQSFRQPELAERALRQAGRELLLAQASDWPFILRTGTSPEYARERINTHLLRFNRIYEALRTGALHLDWLRPIEESDNLFPRLDYRYWRRGGR